jgi:hypothetical protein
MAKKLTAEKADGNTKKDSDIISAAKDCLEKFQDRESDNIRRAEDSILFRAGEQWPDDIKRDREDKSQDGGPRPCPVLDKTNQYVRQVINEERQNRASIKVRPVDDQSDKEVAEVLTGIIRHIEDSSNALDAYTTAGEHAIDGGWGFFRIVTEYCDDLSFDQDIRIKSIPNRFSVAFGPHTEPDGSDVKEAVVLEDVPIETFKAKYPKAKTQGFEDDAWMDEETIRVAEYFKVIPESIKIHMLPDGSVVTDEELDQFPDIEVIKSRITTINRVKWYKITSVEVLDTKDIIGKYIPIIKVIGNYLFMPDGKVRLSGMIEQMMDPQRLHNYAHAGFIEHVALAPRSPWVAASEAVKGYEDDYSQANRRNITLLPFNHLDDAGNPLPMPQRTQPAGISPGWQQMLANTEHGIEASVGMYGASVGAEGQEKSGIALQEQKSQGMVGNFHFPDNLSRSIQHCGRILVDWIPKIYDTARVARIIGEDRTVDSAYLDPDQDEAVAPRLDNMGQKIGLIYNLNIGKYDVTVSTGPSYTSKRQEAFDTQTQIIQARPDLMNIIGDIVFSNMDAPGADKISDRLKKMLPPQLQEPEEGEGEPQIDPRMRMMMQQIEQAGQEIAQRGQMLQQAQTEIEKQAMEVGADKTELDAARVKLESERKVFMAEVETKMLQIENEMLKMQQINQGYDDVKEYEADKKYQAELAKSAAQIIQAQITASGEDVREQDETGRMTAIMEMLDQVAQKLSAPKVTMLINDETGNAIGSRTEIDPGVIQ